MSAKGLSDDKALSRFALGPGQGLVFAPAIEADGRARAGRSRSRGGFGKRAEAYWDLRPERFSFSAPAFDGYHFALAQDSLMANAH
jgi:hypothetical protein